MEAVTAEIHLQISKAARKDSQLTRSDVNQLNQDRVLSYIPCSTASTNCVVSACGRTSCSDYRHDVLERIQSKEELPDVLNSTCKTKIYDTDSAMYSPEVNNGLTCIKSEMQLPETKLEEIVVRLNNTDQMETLSQDVSKPHIEVKTEKIEREDNNSGETRHWVVGAGGVLRQMKVEDTRCVPEACSSETVAEKQQQQQQQQHSNLTDDEISDTQTSATGYACATCVISFQQSNRLLVRINSSTVVKPYNCITCGESFMHYNAFFIHEQQHMKGKCVTCAKLFKWSSDLKRHEMIHPGDKPFTCDTCGKSFTWFSSFIYREKIRMHRKHCVMCGTSIRHSAYTCVHCGKYFKLYSDLKCHKIIHTCAKLHTCSTCGKSFKQPINLRTHKRIHTGVKPYTCSTCGDSFTYSNALKSHKRIHVPYCCITCGKSYSACSSLKAHERSHTGVEPYKCSICEQSFDRLINLCEHERIHSGAEQYPCNVCGKAFIHLTSLKVHEVNHNGVKPHTCSTCGKLFLFSGNLRKHKLLHTGFK